VTTNLISCRALVIIMQWHPLGWVIIWQAFLLYFILYIFPVGMYENVFIKMKIWQNFKNWDKMRSNQFFTVIIYNSILISLVKFYVLTRNLVLSKRKCIQQEMCVSLKSVTMYGIYFSLKSSVLRLQASENQLALQRNILHQSFWLKNKPSNKVAWSRLTLRPRRWSSIFLRNVGWLSSDYETYSRKQNSSWTLLWEPQIDMF
jgi:hypothetical protein